MKIPYRTASKIIDIANLKHDDIDINDIATSLAGICRWNGNTPFHYSVAQHSVLCAVMAPDELKLAALLHDAHEYITGDTSTPFLHLIDMWSDDGIGTIASLKLKIDDIIDQRFFTNIVSESSSVHEIDQRMRATESVHFFGENYTEYPPFVVDIVPWNRNHAMAEFLNQFHMLT